MQLRSPELTPAFDITRASHLVLGCADLERSKAFYTEVVGLAVTLQTADRLYLRGVEEAAHHSLELCRGDGPPFCDRIGMRVRTEDDVFRAERYFRDRNLPAEIVTKPFQGATLHAADPDGLRFELCATMDRVPRLLSDARSHRGAAALRMDHFQVIVPDVDRAYPFYADLGFRVSDYLEDKAGATVLAFMYRKNNPWDLVLARRPGPRFHHFGYVVEGLANIYRACDATAQGGWPDAVERGPGRHPLGHSLYVYLRDPDGHRVELLPPAIQLIDIDEVPMRFDAGKNGFLDMDWGPEPPVRWMEEAMPFGPPGAPH